MENLLELNLGYVSCDIDGEGYNGVGVWYDHWAPADTPFRVIRNSRCYGNIDQSGLTLKEVEKFLEDNSFLVATRRARKAYNAFLRRVKNDKVKVNSPQREAAVESELMEWANPEPLIDDGFDPVSTGCNCEECVEIRAGRSGIVDATRIYTVQPAVTNLGINTSTFATYSWVAN